MKIMKRLAGILLAMLLTLSMTVIAFAAEETTSAPAEGTTTITIEDPTEGAKKYNGYMLMKATNNGDNWYYTVNEKYRSSIIAALGETSMTDEEIKTEINLLSTEEIRTFANKVYMNIKNLGSDLEETDKVFEKVAQGYWLIADISDSSDGITDSLVMLDSAGKSAITVKAKKDTVVVDKKVQENADGEWGNKADYNIGDNVPFKLIGTYSKDYKYYGTAHYKFIFHDTLSGGLTFNPNSVKVTMKDSEDAEPVEKEYYTVVTEGLKDGETFNVVINDLKAVIDKYGDKSGKIYVTYDATLNDGAVIAGLGNPNTVKLEYSNNPYTGTTGETPDIKVIVYTFKLDVNKVDQDGDKLAGAGFTLFRMDGTDEVTTDDWKLAAGTATSFTFKGLDAGTYKLKETTVPDGYNPIDPIVFKVVAGYDENNGKLTSLKVTDIDGNPDKDFTINLNSGNEENISTTIENVSGSILPSTGGIGTTIFTVAGLVLMVLASVLLVLKRSKAVKNN